VRVELLAEVLLDEPLARMTPTQYDFFFEPRCDELGDGRSPRAAFRRHFAQGSFRRRGSAALRRLFSQCPVHGHGEARKPLFCPIGAVAPAAAGCLNKAKAGCLQSYI
jgi:hypothetical protein